MTRQVKIEVTQEDIDNGQPRSTNSCPIALAVKRQFPTASYVSVGHETIVASTGAYAFDKTLLYADSTQAVQRFISTFDRGMPVRPHTFIVRGCL